MPIFRIVLSHGISNDIIPDPIIYGEMVERTVKTCGHNHGCNCWTWEESIVREGIVLSARRHGNA